MKKILFATAIIGLLFAGCDKDPNNGGDPETEAVRKLPSKMILDNVLEVNSFEYDERNRLIRKIEPGSGLSMTISYDVNDNPVRIGYGWNSESGTRTFQYSGNQIFVLRSDDYGSRRDTLTIDVNGQLVELKWEQHGREIMERRETQSFKYDSRGNLTDIVWISYDTFTDDTTTRKYTITHSEVKSLWRHINMPDWFWYYSFFYGFDIFLGCKTGYMPSQIDFREYGAYKYAYGLDADGYVRQMDMMASGSVFMVLTFEYIPAK